ncbi:hypothetical protein MNV49_000863 [Pseudohyphozyma bogoriensis]|nr:hypothetical protein MNV49_000863 [Pseudohyphozyma bogoriensis]
MDPPPPKEHWSLKPSAPPELSFKFGPPPTATTRTAFASSKQERGEDRDGDGEELPEAGDDAHDATTREDERGANEDQGVPSTTTTTTTTTTTSNATKKTDSAFIESFRMRKGLNFNFANSSTSSSGPGDGRMTPLLAPRTLAARSTSTNARAPLQLPPSFQQSLATIDKLSFGGRSVVSGGGGEGVSAEPVAAGAKRKHPGLEVTDSPARAFQPHRPPRQRSKSPAPSSHSRPRSPPPSKKPRHSEPAALGRGSGARSSPFDGSGASTSGRVEGNGPRGSVMSDFLTKASELQKLVENKDLEISRLSTLLETSNTKLDDLLQWKKLLSERVKVALSQGEAARLSFLTAASEMKSGMSDLRNELKGDAVLDTLRSDLDDLKDSIYTKFYDPDDPQSLDGLQKKQSELVRGLETELTKGQEVIAILRSQLVTQAGEMVEARDRISQLETQLTAKIDALAGGFEEGRKELREGVQSRIEIEKELKGWREKCDGGLVDIEEGRRRAGELERELAKEGDKVQKLKTQLEELEAHRGRIAERLEENAKTIKALEAEKVSTQQEYESSKRKLMSDHESAMKGLESRHATKVERLEQDSKILKTGLDDAQSKLVYAKQDVERVTTLLSEAINKSEKERKESSETIAGLQSREKAQTAKMESTEQKISALETKIEDLIRDETRLNSDLSASKEQNANLAQQHVQLTQQHKVAQAEASRSQYLSDELKKSRELAGALQKKLDEAKAGMMESTVEVASLKETNEKLEAQVSTLTEELDDARAQATGAMESEKDIKKLEDDIQKLKSSEKGLNKKIEDLKKENAIEVQKVAAETLRRSEEGFNVEMGLKSNEVKQMKKKYDDASAKLTKALAELQKTKSKAQTTPAPALPPAAPPVPVPVVEDHVDEVPLVNKSDASTLSSIAAAASDEGEDVDAVPLPGSDANGDDHVSSPKFKRERKKKGKVVDFAPAPALGTRRRNKSLAATEAEASAAAAALAIGEDDEIEDDEVSRLKQHRPAGKTYGANKKKK